MLTFKIQETMPITPAPERLTPSRAYLRALLEGSSDETRFTASEDAGLAVLYAKHVDKAHHEVTRIGACHAPETAYQYASEVDKCFRQETFDAVASSDFWLDMYRTYVGASV